MGSNALRKSGTYSPLGARRALLDPMVILQICWRCAQQNNAVMILRGLLPTKEPPSDADQMRELACRTLNGLARHEPIRQILSKMPLISANELNSKSRSIGTLQINYFQR